MKVRLKQTFLHFYKVFLPAPDVSSVPSRWRSRHRGYRPDARPRLASRPLEDPQPAKTKERQSGQTRRTAWGDRAPLHTMLRLWPIRRIDDPTTGSPLPPTGAAAYRRSPRSTRISFLQLVISLKNIEIQKPNDYKGLAELVATNFSTEPLSGKGPRDSPRTDAAWCGSHRSEAPQPPAAKRFCGINGIMPRT